MIENLISSEINKRKKFKRRKMTTVELRKQKLLILSCNIKLAYQSSRVNENSGDSKDSMSINIENERSDEQSSDHWSSNNSEIFKLKKLEALMNDCSNQYMLLNSSSYSNSNIIIPSLSIPPIKDIEELKIQNEREYSYEENKYSDIYTFKVNFDKMADFKYYKPFMNAIAILKEGETENMSINFISKKHKNRIKRIRSTKIRNIVFKKLEIK